MVYSDVDPVLWGAAELSVRAQLDTSRTATEHGAHPPLPVSTIGA